jgi:hypothetical protein
MDTDILHEAKRLRLLAAALELQHYTSTAANMVPIPGGDQVIAIGTPGDVARLLANQAKAAPLEQMDDRDVSQTSCDHDSYDLDEMCGTCDGQGEVTTMGGPMDDEPPIKKCGDCGGTGKA